MNATALIQSLRSKGVILEAHQDRLRLFPRGAIGPAELEELRRHKPELLRVLRSESDTRRSSAEQAANGETTKDSCAESAESPPGVASAKSPRSPLEVPVAPEEHSAEVERMMALGQTFREGKIKAIKCGKDGHRCTVCEGVPCLGSVPWEDA